MTASDNLEQDVRELVRTVVAGLLGDDDGHRQAPQPTSDDAAPAAAPDVIALGADHGGYALKERLAYRLKEAGWEVRDLGTDGTASVDYPTFAHAVARAVATGECRWGIMVDGAGIGSAMVANKVPGVRASLCYDVTTARNAREHNHANVLTLGAGMIGDTLAWQIVEAWLATPWAGGRHARRVEQIMEIERLYARSGA